MTANTGALYDGLLADAYDLYLADETFGDLPFWHRFIGRSNGAGLELGCGTGRLLLPLLAAGLSVDGLDASADMLACCRSKAAKIGLSPRLHLADMGAFSLGRRYAAVFCAVGTMTLLTAPGAMEAALRRAYDHLLPGGRIAVSMDRPISPSAAQEIVPARQAVRPADGALLRCRLEPLASPRPGIDRFRMINEVVVTACGQTERDVRMLEFRRMEPVAFAALLEEAGFTEIGVLGPRGETREDPMNGFGEASYIATGVARRPARVGP